MLQALDDMLEPLRAMGFETLQAFEEVTNSPENVSPRDPRFCQGAELTVFCVVGGSSVARGWVISVRWSPRGFLDAKF